MISEIPLVEDPDLDEEENLDDMTLMDEDVPMGMESNMLYIFEVKEGDEKDTYTSKMVDKLHIEDVNKLKEPNFKKTGGAL